MHRLFFENLLPGTLLFSRFRLVRCLSATDVCGIYLCGDEQFPGNYRAVKVVSLTGRTTEAVDEALRDEHRIGSTVRHPHVVRAFEFFRDDDIAAFSMEYIAGGTLADRLVSRKPFSLDTALHVTSQLCGALKAVHDAGIIHRDIKPQNVLMQPEGLIKLADFGIARGMGTPDPDGAHRISGTIDYLSPEYIQFGEYSPRSDIYSVGVIAYQMITGALPFEGSSLVEILTRRVLAEPDRVKELRPECPESLAELTERALAKSPRHRFQSVGEILPLLARVRNELRSGLDASAA